MAKKAYIRIDLNFTILGYRGKPITVAIQDGEQVDRHDATLRDVIVQIVEVPSQERGQKMRGAILAIKAQDFDNDHLDLDSEDEAMLKDRGQTATSDISYYRMVEYFRTCHSEQDDPKESKPDDDPNVGDEGDE